MASTSICVLVKFSPVTSFLQLKSHCSVTVMACMPLFGQLQAHMPKRIITIHNYETNMVLHDSHRKTLGGGGNRSRHSNSLYKCPLQQWKIAAHNELWLLNIAIFIPPEKNWITIWKQRSSWIWMQHPMKSSLYIASILKILPSEF